MATVDAMLAIWPHPGRADEKSLSLSLFKADMATVDAMLAIAESAHRCIYLG